MSGTIQNNPGPRRPLYLPSRNTTARSHCRATRGASMSTRPTTTPARAPPGFRCATVTAAPAPIEPSRMNQAMTFDRTLTCACCCRRATTLFFLGMSGLLLGGARRLEPLEVLHDLGKRDADRRRVREEPVDE